MIELTQAELDQITLAPLRTDGERMVARAAFRAGILAGLERAAKVCEALPRRMPSQMDPVTHINPDYFIHTGPIECAAAIREATP